jgi:hypothetical protein
MKISPIVPLRERVPSLVDGGLKSIVLSTDTFLVVGQQNAVILTEKDSIPAAKSGSVCLESRLF